MEYRNALNDFLEQTSLELRRYADDLDGEGPAWPNEVADSLRGLADQLYRIANNAASAETLIFLTELSNWVWAEIDEENALE